MSIHDGHRERLKERYRQEGLDNFDEVNALELLLFYCVPRQDTNPIAHRLLDHFGSFTRVLEAPREELEKVPGVGKNVATYLKFTMDMMRYYMTKNQNEVEILNDMNEVGNYLLPRFLGRDKETVFLLCLDGKCKVLCCKEVGEGSVNSAAISVRKIVEVAMGCNATSVVLAHNHPSGFAVPSDEDKQTTHRLACALQAVDIILADHIVVADGNFVSMRQSREYSPDVDYVVL